MLQKLTPKNYFIHFYILEKDDFNLKNDNIPIINRICVFLRDPSVYGSHLSWINNHFDKLTSLLTDEVEELVQKTDPESGKTVDAALKTIRFYCEQKEAIRYFYNQYKRDPEYFEEKKKYVPLPYLALIIQSEEDFNSFFTEFRKELLSDENIKRDEVIPFFNELKENGCTFYMKDENGKKHELVIE